MLPPPIRTIALGVAEPHPVSERVIQQVALLLKQAQEQFRGAGYEVQSVRLAMRPLFADLAPWSSAAIMTYVHDLQLMLDELDLAFCSLGPAQPRLVDFPLERIDLIPDLLLQARSMSATIQLATLEEGICAEAAIPAARVIQRLAQESEEGFGNFRFAVLACMSPGSPFFPAAYHEGKSKLSIGVQGASIISHALEAHQQRMTSPLDLALITQEVRAALIASLSPIATLAQQWAQQYGVHFNGLDLSPAPMGDDSIATAIELCGYGAVGSAGTLAVVAALTAALKSTGLPGCGYSGLMLPVLEDARLGKRWEEGYVDVHKLLLYSTLCGTGLDTIPLPGNVSTEVIAQLLLDVATLAIRLQKPLSARLFPVPGKGVGERTTFTSPYLVNTLIRDVV